MPQSRISGDLNVSPDSLPAALGQINHKDRSVQVVYVRGLTDW